MMNEIYSQICRLCLQITCDLLPIYGEGNCDKISRTIMACTIVKVTKNDGYPENVCFSCIKRLNNAFEFKQLCENSDALLRETNIADFNTKSDNCNITTDDELIESENLISSNKNKDNDCINNIVLSSPAPEELVESVMCKEEEPSMDGNNINDQYEIIFDYPESIEKHILHEGDINFIPPKTIESTSDITTKKNKICTKKSATRGKTNKKNSKSKKELQNLGPYKCKICDREFNSLTGQKNHERSHEFVKSTQCVVCQKVFSHAGNMRRHALIHQGVKPHVCHLCGKKFSRSSTLRDHVDIHHARNLKQYSCTLCDYTNVRRHALQVHMAAKHESGSAISGKPRISKPTPRSCKICDKILSSAASLNMHMKIHNNIREHLCRHCGRAFHHKAGLENHERIHTGEKPYVCPHCPKRFSQQIGLRIHVRTHTGERPYQCKLCLKTFSQQTHLRTHSFTHSGERRYSCDVCNKRFALREGLRYHQMTHTGETPFKCTLCNRGFYIQYKLKVHMAKSHGVIVEIIKK